MAENTENLTVRTILNLVSQRWPLVVMALAAFAIGTLVYAHYLSLTYTGTTIFERRKDSSAADPSTLRGGSESFEGQKLTLKHELAGMIAVSEAVEQLNLTKGFQHDSSGQLTVEGQRSKQKLVEEIMGRIKIKWITDQSAIDLDLVSVSFEDSDPQLAKNMPNTLVSNYINLISKQSEERLSASRDFLVSQVTNCNNQYSEQMRKRIDFEVKNAGLLPDSPAMLYEGLTRLNADLDALRLQNEVAKQTLVGLEEMTPSAASTEDPNTSKPMQVYYGPNPEYKKLEQDLRDAKEALAVALVEKTEKHPIVEKLQQQIARIEKQLGETEKETELQKVYGSSTDSSLAIQMLTTKASAEMTEKEMARVETRLEVHKNLLNNFGPIRREYLEIVKKLEEQQAELSQWDNRLRDVHMALAAEVAKRRTHLNAVQPALEQYYPSSPEFKKVLGFALAGGLAFGIGLLILIHRLDRSVMTPEQATRVLGIPVYGYVDVILTPAQMTWRWVKRWILLPVIFLVLALAFAVCCYSLSLRLNAPDEYGQWRARPAQYLSEQIRNRLHFSEETGGY